MKLKKESHKAGLKLNIQNTEIMASGPITSWQIDGEKNGNSDRLYFLGLQNHCRRWLQPWNKKMLTPWKESYDQPRQHIKKQKHYFANKGPSSQRRFFQWSCLDVKLDYKESWVPKNWCFWTIALDKTLESSLDSKEIKLVNPKGNELWIFIRWTDADAPILWPPDAKSQLIRKDPDAGKDWWQEEKRATEDVMVGWCHQFDGHELGQAPGDGDGQGSLAGCSPWGCKESDLA